MISYAEQVKNLVNASIHHPSGGNANTLRYFKNKLTAIMKQTLKEINLITLPVAILLNDIANTNAELIHPELFASRSKTIYRELLDGLQVYLFDDNLYMLNHYFEARDALKHLLDRAEELATYHSVLSGKTDVSPYRAGQAMFISGQLSDLIAFIQPDNLIKL